jgi:hypothetical protein
MKREAVYIFLDTEALKLKENNLQEVYFFKPLCFLYPCLSTGRFVIQLFIFKQLPTITIIHLSPIHFP